MNQFLLIRRFLQELPPIVKELNDIGDELFELPDEDIPSTEDLKVKIASSDFIVDFRLFIVIATSDKLDLGCHYRTFPSSRYVRLEN